MRTVVLNHRKREIIATLITQGRADLATAVSQEEILGEDFMAKLNPTAATAASGGSKSKQRADWMKKFKNAAEKLGEHPGKINWDDANYLHKQGVRPEEAAKKIYGNTKMEIISTLLKQKRHDLADLIATPVERSPVTAAVVTAAPGYKKVDGSGKFDVETETVGVRITSDRPYHNVDVYSPLANVGKRGQDVERYQYRLISSDKDKGVWGSTLKKRVKGRANASLHEVLSIVRSMFQEAERESIARADKYPSRLYGPHKSSLKGGDASIPDSSTSPVYAGRNGNDIAVSFCKPTITFTSRKDARAAGVSSEYHYLTANWRYAKKVEDMSRALARLKGLKAVESALAEAKISFKINRYGA